MNACPMLTPEQSLTSCLQYHCSGEVYPQHVQVPCAETSISLYFKGVQSWGRSRRVNCSDQNVCPFLEAWDLRLITVTYCLFPLRNSLVFQRVGALKTNLHLERLSVRKGDTWSRRNVRFSRRSRREEFRKSCRLQEPALALPDLGCLLLCPSPPTLTSPTLLELPYKCEESSQTLGIQRRYSFKWPEADLVFESSREDTHNSGPPLSTPTHFRKFSHIDPMRKSFDQVLMLYILFQEVIIFIKQRNTNLKKSPNNMYDAPHTYRLLYKYFSVNNYFRHSTQILFLDIQRIISAF